MNRGMWLVLAAGAVLIALTSWIQSWLDGRNE